MMARVVSIWDHPHPQSRCPFFSKLPAEIRTIVFEYALTETLVTYSRQKLRFNIRNGHQSLESNKWKDYLTLGRWVDGNAICEVEGGGGVWWPGREGPTVIRTALLRTCRRIYLETAHLPAFNRELSYAEGDTAGHWTNLTPPLRNIQLSAPYHAARRIRRLHLLVPFEWIEHEFEKLVDGRIHTWGSFVAHPAHTVRLFDNIRHFRITIHDHSIARHLAFGHEPERWPDDLSFPLTDDTPEANPRWGSSFARMPSIASFIIDFETFYADICPTMETLVKFVTAHWKFPTATAVPDGVATDDEDDDDRPLRAGVLTPEDHPVRRWSFGAHHERCSWNRPTTRPPPKPRFRSKPYTYDGLCEMCSQSGRREAMRPLTVNVWTVKWTVKPLVPWTAEEMRLIKREEERNRREIMLPARTVEEYREWSRYRLCFGI